MAELGFKARSHHRVSPPGLAADRVAHPALGDPGEGCEEVLRGRKVAGTIVRPQHQTPLSTRGIHSRGESVLPWVEESQQGAEAAPCPRGVHSAGQAPQDSCHGLSKDLSDLTAPRLGAPHVSPVPRSQRQSAPASTPRFGPPGSPPFPLTHVQRTQGLRAPHPQPLPPPPSSTHPCYFILKITCSPVNPLPQWPPPL